MDHLQNVLSYFDQQQPLCAEHDRIPKDLYREFGVKAGLRDETGKGVLAGLTNISDIRAFQYVDGVKHPADGQLLYRGYDVKDLINGSRGSRFAFEEAGYLLLFGQLPTPEQLEQFCAVLGECRTMPTNFTRDVIMKAPSHDIMNSMARSYLLAYGLPLRLREEFRAGLHRLQGEYVDIFIGNHQDQCDTIGKSERIRAGEADAFVDPSAWPLYLADCEQKLDRMLAEEAESFRTGE